MNYLTNNNKFKQYSFFIKLTHVSVRKQFSTRQRSSVKKIL